MDRAWNPLSRLFYNSHIWKRASQLDEPVSLNGYINVLSKIINRFPGEMINDFKIAHHLKFVMIYQDKTQKLFIKPGAKKDEVL